MSDDLEPVPADGPQPAKDLWGDSTGPTPLETRLAQNPLLVSSAPPATPSRAVKTRPLSLAFLAAAGAALLGALAWAAITVATGYNLGFLALIIGALTGFTAQLVAGAGIGGFERVLSGVFAAGAIIVGNYVIFVHEVRVHEGALLVSHGIQIGYLSGDQLSFFAHNFGTVIHGFDWLWIAIAAYAAVRTSGGKVVMGIGGSRH